MALRRLKEFYHLNDVWMFQTFQRQVALVYPGLKPSCATMWIVPDKFNGERASILINGGIDITASASADSFQEMVSVSSRINEKVIHKALLD
jgi:hypothetical protein